MNLLELKKSAIEKVKKAFINQAPKAIIQVQIIDLFQHIKYLKGGPICYFKDKNSEIQMLAHGAYEVYQDISEIVFNDNEIIFGAEKFPSKIDNQNNGYFFKPIIVYKKSKSTYDVNIEINLNYRLLKNKKEFSKFIFHLSDLFDFRNEMERKLPKLKDVIEVPEIDDWKSKVEKVTKIITDNQKIVLSRKKLISFEENVHENSILENIPNCDGQYLFFLKPNQDEYFISVSPERLFFQENQNITIDCIAGTRPRGKSSSRDKELERELIHSKKERSEHLFVANFIEKEMNQLCDELLMTKAFDILKLSKVQHLHSEFIGKLKSDVTPSKILKKIYPTPAIAGTPSKYAIEHIADIESSSREYYAGACGYLSRSKSELLVGIRSIHVRSNEVHIFGGAGIISDSNYKSEWNETEQKMKNFSFLWER